MYKSIPFVFLVLLSSAACPAVDDNVIVFVSILPQKFLVESIGGSRVEVHTMVKPGHSPETYDPTTGQMRALDKARLYFRICVPFEQNWMATIASNNRNLKIIDCNPAIVYRELDARHDDDSGRGHSAIHDPHVWTSPFNAILLAEQIRDVLVDEDPEYRRYYEANFLALKSELIGLDEHIKKELAAVNSPYILVSHSSWGYFTDRYGLVQISLETDGKERGPRGLGDLVDVAARHNIKTLFIQKQHQSSAAGVFAGEIGAKLVEIDPLAEAYIANLKAVTGAFVEATR